MIPDVERNTTAQDDQTLPPATSPQIAPPASQRRGGDILLRSLGVAVAFVGGGMFSIPVPDVVPLAVWVLEPVLWAVIAGLLLRSWWTMLIVPVVFVAGFFVGDAIQMYGFDLHSWFTGGFGDTDIVVPLVVVPSVIGAAVGASIGVWAKQRRLR